MTHLRYFTLGAILVLLLVALMLFSVYFPIFNIIQVTG